MLGKDNSSEIVEAVISQLLDEALGSCVIDTLLEHSKCMPCNEEDIVKRIKDLRRMYDSRTSESDLATTVSNSWIDSFENKVDDDDDRENVCDRHWKRDSCDSQKRKRSVSPSYFGNIDISPVKKVVRSNSPSCSSRSASKSYGSSSLPCSNPWSATEAPPTIFWSNVKSQAKERESDQVASFIGSDDNPEEEEQESFCGEKVNNVCDLRELLKLRRSGKSHDQTFNFGKQGSIIDKFKATGKDTGIRKVVETYDREPSHYEASECEEGEIFDSDGIDMHNQHEDNNEEAPVYRGYRMGDLVRRKKVLEHLIEMANKEECAGSEDNESFESERGPPLCQEEDSNVEGHTFATHNVTISRKVVYRGSSPHTDNEIRENILKDFTAEMDKRMGELFQSKKDQRDTSIKVEPVSDEEESNGVSEEVTKHMVKEGSKSNSPWSCKYKPKIQEEVKRSNSPSSYRYECSICKVVVGTKFSMEQHRKGRRHKLNIEREKSIRAGPVSSSGYNNYKRREVGKHSNSHSGKQPRKGGCESAYDKRGAVGPSAKGKHSSGDYSRSHGIGVRSRNIGVMNNEVSRNEVARNIKVISGKRNVKNESADSKADINFENKESKSVSKPTRKKIVWDLK